ncbi:hypothetical protein DPMN_054641 [Dreissena polymorpha]|uniref:Uncharacterized protein n=1 Tax=Dreissena polymorpha TaxID=45954 RepID=A0A9D4HRS0_DREPO|nr:hypothetical protein DPMN_054641 [Dreissena polymorpha]
MKLKHKRVLSHVSRRRNARQACRTTDSPTHWAAALCERRPILCNRFASSRVRLSSCSNELLAFAKWFLRQVATAGRALAWLALYKRPMSLLSNTGPRRSATARETRHVARENKSSPIYMEMLSCPSVRPKRGSTPLIGTVAISDTWKSQPPIDYRPNAGLWKPSFRQGPPAAYAGLVRLVRKGVRGRRQRHTVPWVPSETARRSVLARSVAPPFTHAPRESDQRSGIASW